MTDSLPPTVWGIGVDPGLDGAIVAMRQVYGDVPNVVGVVHLRDVYSGVQSGMLGVAQVAERVAADGGFPGRTDRVRVVVERPVMGRRDGRQGSRAQLAAVASDVDAISTALWLRYGSVDKLETAHIQRLTGIKARGKTRKHDIAVALRDMQLGGRIVWPAMQDHVTGPRGALRDGVTDAAMMALAALVQARALWWPRQTVGGAA